MKKNNIHTSQSHKKPRSAFRVFFIRAFFIIGAITLIGFGAIALWISTFRLPSLDSFEERKIVSSTKIYDSTGEVLLYDLNQDVRRTIVPYYDIATSAKNAIVATEDTRFYEHDGLRVRAIIRATVANILSGSFSEGGSTLTQQVVKNTLLTQEKRISRKLKEWFLSLKLEQVLSKDEILALYLNEAPYGGTLYGIQEASRAFFGVDARDLTLAQSAYLAAIPNAPSFFSPYGQNRDRLEARKNTVLHRMYALGFITEEDRDDALSEEVEFLPRSARHAQSLHFVQYVIEQLERNYGADVLRSGGLSVITTLDFDLQKHAEAVAYEHAFKNEEEWNASNIGIVVLDPNTGHIRTMVGSRDYNDTEIDGNFNIALARRQPGSAFKPFVYAEAFAQGYPDTTTIFDTRTQFSTSCPATSFSNESPCYSPSNYDGQYKGPVTLREALAQSRNVPSVKLLHLVGIENAIQTARRMGITTLGQASRYGLTLVLGGGEVRLLDMTNAYGVFATEGVRVPPVSILEIRDSNENTIYQHVPRPENVLDPEAARVINNLLSDNDARTPLFGPTSFLYFANRDVAGKTGTTNDNRDAWLVGYTPDVVVGVWSGNNDNSPMTRGSAISGAPWRSVMEKALTGIPPQSFTQPRTPDENHKPILRGLWHGGESVIIDTVSGGLATEYTPPETQEEIVIPAVHSILHWIDRRDPFGPPPEDPTRDSQYTRWEAPVTAWAQQNAHLIPPQPTLPTFYDNVHTPESQPTITLSVPTEATLFTTIPISIDYDGVHEFATMDIFLGGIFLGRSHQQTFSFIPENEDITPGTHTLRVVVRDDVHNSTEETVSLVIE